MHTRRYDIQNFIFFCTRDHTVFRTFFEIIWLCIGEATSVSQLLHFSFICTIVLKNLARLLLIFENNKGDVNL